MRLETTPRPDYALRVNTRLIASNTILHYSSDEMEQALKQEQQENALFDVKEHAICLRCGTSLHGSYCPTCGMQTLEISRISSLQSYQQELTQQSASYTCDQQIGDGISDDDMYNPFTALPFRETLADTLLQQLTLLVDPSDIPIAEQLVGNLDEHGYLAESVGEIADYLKVPVERVERVLCQLQTLDPPGIGARNLRECLLLQLHRLREDSYPHPLIHTIIEQHLEQLGRNRFSEIARILHIPECDILHVKHYIRTVLHPFPASIYQADRHVPSMDQQAYYIRPDVIIRKDGSTIVVELVETLRYTFHIGVSDFSDINLVMSITKEEEQYIRTYSDRARYFVASIQRRWHLLKYVTEAIVGEQRAFLEKKAPYLSPLTQVALAEQLGLDESTVSRAIAHKYALLPDGRLMPLASFFDNTQEPKEHLREVISQERPDHCMSDEELACLLTTKGIPIARRTVTKYRKSLGIGSAHERKQVAHSTYPK